MPELSEIINVNPKRRITIPEGQIALLIPINLAEELRSMCLTLRKGKRIDPADKKGIHNICGDLILALLEAEYGQ